MLPSSPELGPSHGDPIADDEGHDLETLQDAILATQLDVMDDIHADDPNIDWRALDPDVGDDDDVISDPDELPEADAYQIPRMICLAETAATAHSTTCLNHPVHQRYKEFLVGLCLHTGTPEAEAYTMEGLPYLICQSMSLSIEIDHSANPDLDLYAHALVIHVWLAVCLRLLQGVSPPDDSLTFELAAYFLSAHGFTQVQFDVHVEELRFAVQYWEQRLGSMVKGNAWSRGQWFRAIPPPDPIAPSYRNPIADEYLQSMEENGKTGLMVLIKHKDNVSPHGTPLAKFMGRGMEYSSLINMEILDILASMDVELLKALINGSLSRKAEITHGPVHSALQKMSEQVPAPPSIYMNTICDRAGISPTPTQWQNVCAHMVAYVMGGKESDELATIIDQLVCPPAKWPRRLANLGLRRYTEWRSYIEGDGDRQPNRSRRQMVQYFASQMQARIYGDLHNDRGHIPLEAGVNEIGFSIHTEHRLREHRQHRNSNYLMNLAESLFHHLYPGSFRLQQLVIYTCYQPTQCWFSEIILTQIGQGYTEGAGGFSHYTAGRSNGGAYKTTSKQDWAKFRHEASRSGELVREIRKMGDEARKMENTQRQRQAEAEDHLTKQERFYQALNGSLDAAIEMVHGALEAKQDQGATDKFY
jgi:hypothetical protein